jgi:hypothetical protein
MGVRAIFYRDGQFCNESSWGVGSSALGKDIVLSLLAGTEVTAFGVTANYAVEMMRIVGRTGKFHDSVDWATDDHDFDMNTPTPGAHWGKVRALRSAARRVEFFANDVRDSGVFHVLSAPLFAVAGWLRDTAALNDETRSAEKPLRAGVQLPKVKCGNRAVGAEAIWFDDQTGVFNFGCVQLGVNKLGRLIAAALMRGDEKVQVGDFVVTVNYLVEMCRLCGRFGRFVHYNDDLFDGNVPPANGYRDFTDFDVEDVRREREDVLFCSLR